MESMIERIVRFEVNREKQPSFLCTPDALEELAVGHLLAEGTIQNAKQVLTVRAEELAVFVQTDAPLRAPLTIEERIEALTPVKKGAQMSAEDISALMQRLLKEETFFGTHCIALKTPDEIVFREDVGRHNALDKVIGFGGGKNIDFSHCAIAATGRISLEMLLKAATVGIPIILSKKYPSDLSLSLAESLGILIIEKAR